MADENTFNAASGVGEVTGRAYYASVSTPNTTFAHKWEVNLVLDDDTLADFENRGHPVKEKDYGRFINFKRNVEKNGGGQNSRPVLIDENRNKVDTLPKIGNGSLVKVQYGEYAWEYKGRAGKGRDLKAIQLIDLVEYIEQDGAGMYDEGDF
jgi:hypothetical protein|tara:strand:- start:2182 stop:2637 length:456 start_codon:yes stop_codon:yes gene_type:complete